MKLDDLPSTLTALTPSEDLLSPLLQGPATAPMRPDEPCVSAPIHGVLIGELIALTEDGQVPLVRFHGRPAAAARTTVDLHGPHIGANVVLMFDQGDPARPIVIGVLRQAGWPLPDPPAQVSVDADGVRMVVSAKEQLVLRCGKSSITLTKAGKVLIEGNYVLSRSTGVNRIKGGSVHLN